MQGKSGLGMQVYGMNPPAPTGPNIQPNAHPYTVDVNNIPEGRRQLVEQIISDVVYAKDIYFKEDFRQMREDMQFAYDGADTEWIGNGNYIANITQRHIAQKTATLYAKNPVAVAKRKPKMDFAIWDEDMQSIVQAYQLLQSGAYDVNAIALLQDYQQGTNAKLMANKIAKTIEILYGYYQNEQNPSFKAEMKQVVRRTITCGVGYVKHGFQRVNGTSPDVARNLYDFDRRLKTLQRLMADAKNNDDYDYQADIEQTQLIIAELSAEPEMLLREGLTFNFPLSMAIIPDPKCTNLVGFKNADWLAEEYHFSAEEIEEVWKIDITSGNGAKSYTRREDTNQFWTGIVDQDGNKMRKQEKDGCSIYRCWEVYNIKTGLVYMVAEGFGDFLEEPHVPDVECPGFYPYHALVFNNIESVTKLIPHSDVFLIRDQQREINRQREGLRSHRIANRPRYLAPRGSLEEDDKDRLVSAEDSGIIEVNNLKVGQNSSEIIQPMKMAGIDPNLYDVQQSYDDLLRVIGSQEANLGGTSNSTATEASIGESSRISASDSNRDDLDMLLSNVARTSGEILFAELDVATVKEIVGPGAVWPTLTRSDRAKEIILDIQAGSSGKPNQALAIANLERLTPLFLQLPGVKVDRIIKEAVDRLGDNLDVNEFMQSGAPSIQAMNAMFSKGGGGVPVGNPQTGGAVAANGTPNAIASPQPQSQTQPVGQQLIPGQ